MTATSPQACVMPRWSSASRAHNVRRTTCLLSETCSFFIRRMGSSQVNTCLLSETCRLFHQKVGSSQVNTCLLSGLQGLSSKARQQVKLRWWHVMCGSCGWAGGGGLSGEVALWVLDKLEELPQAKKGCMGFSMPMLSCACWDVACKQ